MKIIIGLGNPGNKYQKTRHNVGFMFLEYLIQQENFGNFKSESKFKGEISTGIFNGEKVILLKPQTFMNLSGESVRKIIDFYKLDSKDIFVIYDDMSMDFSKLRFRDKGSAGGHNGIKNIITHLSDQFKRIKIGIGFNTNYEVSDWVLSNFNKEEINELKDEIFPEVYKLLKEKV
ncbi:MAG: aminoacyl-tRNA hydrolase [Candidatus Gracilibacteria bacterium]